MSASYGRSRSGDRFYNPPAVRRQLQLQQQQQLELQQQQQQQQQLLQKKKEAARQKRAAALVAQRAELDDCASTATTMLTSSVSSHSSHSASGVVSNLTNFDRFLEYTTPVVPAHYVSKTTMRGWRYEEHEFQPYFMLGDLWESFKEWSAYGAGVPLLLNGSDSVVQYYVPYLSGIQLYIDLSNPSPRNRRSGEESDAESSRETSSNGSSDCETDRGRNGFLSGERSQQDLTESNLQYVKRLLVRNKPLSGSSSDESEYCGSPGALIFEYLEHDPPYCREPLADKISLLSSQFPQLKTYRSCDLSPASWVSVAWYPIYRIPTGPTLQNLDSCFLTFHSLSTPIRGNKNIWECLRGSSPREVRNGYDTSIKLALPIFGMACYKFKISVWDHSAVDESEKASSLFRAADDWLRLLNVSHPDFRFFLSHNYYGR